MPNVTLAWPTFAPAPFRGGTITVGNFDGVHNGHKALLAAALASGPRPVVAVTFNPPPLTLLNPTATKPPLLTPEHKAVLLEKAGADGVVTLKAEPSLLALSPEAFFEDVLRDMLGAKAVVEGYDFRFARGRTGNNTILKTLCEAGGVAFTEVPPQNVNGEVVSSSKVRVALAAGDVATATRLLGRRYTLTGTVIAGAKRGRTIGFPTANLDNVATLVPGTGVYAMLAKVNNTIYSAAANVGPNPTFGEDARKIEVHLIDFAGDIYGASVTVAFVEKLRDTVAFSGLETLKAQLTKDIQQARAAMANIIGKPDEDMP